MENRTYRPRYNVQCLVAWHDKCGGKISGGGLCTCPCHPFRVIVKCPICDREYTFKNAHVDSLDVMYGATTNCRECNGVLIFTRDGNSDREIAERGHFAPDDFFMSMKRDIQKRLGYTDEQMKEVMFGSIDLDTDNTTEQED